MSKHYATIREDDWFEPSCFFCDCSPSYMEVRHVISIENRAILICDDCYTALVDEVLSQDHTNQVLDDYVNSHTNKPHNKFTVEEWRETIENLGKKI